MFHAFFGETERWARMVEMAASSVRAVYPQARIVLLTNIGKGEARIPEFVEIVPVAAARETLMLSRIQVHLRFASEHAAAGHLILLDTTCCCCGASTSFSSMTMISA